MNNMIFELNKFEKNLALISEEKTWTYGQLQNVSEEIYNAVGERCLILLLCTNSFESIAGYVAFMNKKVVPMMIDADLDDELTLKLLKLYKPKYIWLPSTLRNKFPTLREKLKLDEYVLLATGYEKNFELHKDLALLMTTSGSTGSPKFVRQSYENILSNTESIIEYLNITSEDRAVTNLPMNYVYGLSIINTHLKCGASIVVTEKTLFQKEFWALMKNEGVTNLNGVPYTFMMLDKLRFMKMSLPALNFITQAGGKLDFKLHKKFAEYAVNTDKKFFVMYGAAEATARMGYLPPENSLKKCGSIGIAIPGGRFEIVDTDGNVIDEPNCAGELIYYGKNVSLGYAERGEDLILDDVRHGRLETGDIAERDEDGYYKIVGRKKRFLKIFGKRINLQEVEHILYEHFGITEIACAGIDDKMYIFVTDNSVAENIVSYLSLKLNLNHAAFKVKLIEKIPKNAFGKITYKELEKFYDS